MERDFEKFKKWELIEKRRQYDLFEKARIKAVGIADACEDPAGKKTLMSIAGKMVFVFDRQYLIHYGNCSKLVKKVSFIPNTCQIETQRCFEHRRAAFVGTNGNEPPKTNVNEQPK